MLGRGEAGAPAVVVPGGPRLTYRELREEVSRGAEALAALGLRRDQAIGMVFENGPEAIVLFLAVAAVGAAAPLNPAYTEAELRFYLDDVDAGALIVPPGGAAAARAARPDGAVLVEASIDADGRLRVEAPGRPATTAEPEEPVGEDVALMLHTSGTTGRPKRVPLRHRNLVASVANIAATYQLGPEDVSLCAMPLFHVHGLLASALSTLATGGTVVVPSPFNPLGFWPVVREQRPTWYSAVPTIHRMVLSRARDERPAGIESLRFVRSCSSALPPELMADIERLLDASGTSPAAGTAGQVAIRGPNVIDGYAANPQANAESFVDGWFLTGDQGVLDERGYLTLIGRIKELINRGGEKISPREIDEVLLRHPAVAEAVAFGAPHPTLGEEVAAAVVLRADASERDLLAHCREHLAAFKVPRKLHVVEAIPLTATGKVQRRRVAEVIGAGR